MKHLKIKRLKGLLIFFLALSVGSYAQTKKKTYSEKFNVNPDVTIDINTSYTDIEFDTWNKNIVEVDAVIEVDESDAAKAEDIFKNWNFKASGNSNLVEISTKPAMRMGNNMVIVGNDNFDFDFDFEMPEIPEIPEIHFEMPEIAPVPPMPPIPLNFGDISFDYEAYKKDGDKYLKEWKEKFSKNFDENFKESMADWKKEMELHKKEWAKEREKALEEREKMKAEQYKMREEQRAELEKVREEARAEAMKAREEARKARDEQRIIIRNNLKNREDGSNVFYYSTSEGEKNLKIKKTIRIRMPKGAKLKMNVRHGEVKLSEASSNDIKATLSHTRLLASVIDGTGTMIEASYSPIIVDQWNYGELRLNYARDVELKIVKSMKLDSKSSDVIIGSLHGDAIVNGSFGNLKIDNVADSFKRLDLVLDNSDAILVLPGSAYEFYCNSKSSRIKFPKALVLDISKNYSTQLARGYSKQKNSDKTVSIVATYSEVDVQQN